MHEHRSSILHLAPIKNEQIIKRYRLIKHYTQLSLTNLEPSTTIYFYPNHYQTNTLLGAAEKTPFTKNLLHVTNNYQSSHSIAQTAITKHQSLAVHLTSITKQHSCNNSHHATPLVLGNIPLKHLILISK